LQDGFNGAELIEDGQNMADNTKNVSADTEEEDSNNTEFVKNTQLVQHSGIGSSQNISPEIAIPLRIQNDMQFLKNSWANLADVEDDHEADEVLKSQQRNIDEQIAKETQHNIDESGFQIVTYKANRKQQVKSIPASSSTYPTRSKAAHPKPFR